MIRNNQLVVFCPFVNKNYKNTWNNCLEFECSNGKVDTYYSEKERRFRQENYLPDISDWWANGNIICSQHQKLGEAAEDTQWWGDSFNFQLKDMIAETCRSRSVPDCEFFINKRDYPQIKFHVDETGSGDEEFEYDACGRPVTRGQVVEPYGFIFDKDDTDPAQDVPLNEHRYETYAPILSFYSSKRFSDIPFPSTEDWESATGEMFVNSLIPGKTKPGQKPDIGKPRELYTENNFRKFECAWEDKMPTAFFRGTATGGGTTVETNQRLHVSFLSYEWEKEHQNADISQVSPAFWMQK